MTTRLIYLIGQPGSGKSTLMAQLTAPFHRVPVGPPEFPVDHAQLFRTVPGGYDDGTVELIGAEIGKRRDLFSGTDALPSSIIERAIPWIETEPYPLLLAEGARLANARFIKAATGCYYVTLVLLDHPDAEAWRKRRAKEIGREQNLSWVKGRLTADRRLADKMESVPHVVVLRGSPDELYPVLAGMLHITEQPLNLG